MARLSTTTQVFDAGDSGAFNVNPISSAVVVGTSVAAAASLAGLATSTLIGMSLIAGTASAVSSSK